MDMKLEVPTHPVSDLDGNGWLLQQIVNRAPGR
jgi:hypothetical protein